MKPLVYNISDPKKAFIWTIVHVLLGAVTTVLPKIFTIYFLFVFFYNAPRAFQEALKGRVGYMILFLSYIFGFEILARITISTPLPPYEYTKYFLIAASVFLILTGRHTIQRTGIILFVCLLPAFFFDQSGSVISNDIINFLLGPIGLALGVAVFGSQLPSPDLIDKSLRLIWFPMVAIVVNMFIKTPELDQLTFGLSSNDMSTGGAKSNQASTMLGLGMFLAYYSMHTGKKFSGRRILDGGLMMLFAFQGLLTFSRGGIIVGLISIILVIMTTDQFQSKAAGKRGVGGRRKSSMVFILIGILFLFLAFNIVDSVTGGMLTLRYKGETAGTLVGAAEKDMSKFTSGRSTLIEEDLSIWMKYPIFGAGAGSSGHLRQNMSPDGLFLAPHVEFSRLLAEHGILGLVYFILLLFIGWTTWLARKRMNSGNILFILFVIGFLTSFHAATRTFVTPFFIAVSSMSLRAVFADKRR